MDVADLLPKSSIVEDVSIPSPAGDLNGDGFVGIEDLNAILGHWNAGSPPTASGGTIPEPASYMAMLVFVTGLGRRFR